jgi:hypothetical protein
MLDIERWLPERWDQIVGNQELKEYFWDLIHCVRKEGHRSGFNLLLTGPSRGGKTSGVTFGIKCLLCLDFDFKTMNPCGSCPNCRMKVHLYGNDGWEDFITFSRDQKNLRPTRFHFLPLDCTRLDADDLERILTRVSVDDETLRVVYLDEVHRLNRRSLDERLLKPLEHSRAIWIASSAYVKKGGDADGKRLEKMFQNRFTYRIDTQKPTVQELAVWLAERCEEWGIHCDDPKAALTRLAQRSNQIPGMALQVLNKAHKRRSKLLTSQMVDQHIFDLDD